MGTDHSAGLPEEVVEPVPPIAGRGTYIGSACCGRMRLANYNGIVIGACPDHSPIVIRNGDRITGVWDNVWGPTTYG